jgi:hypothetical protein
MLTQCYKTEWIRKAIELNPYSSEQYVWVDFGIFHMMNDDEDILIYGLNNIVNHSYDNVRMPSCWDINIQYCLRLYEEPAWYFAGSVFGGNKNALIFFADIMKQTCISIIEDHHTIMWEINIWYMIHFGYPNLFNFYMSDHSPSILLSY